MFMCCKEFQFVDTASPNSHFLFSHVGFYKLNVTSCFLQFHSLYETDKNPSGIKKLEIPLELAVTAAGKKFFKKMPFFGG